MLDAIFLSERFAGNSREDTLTNEEPRRAARPAAECALALAGLLCGLLFLPLCRVAHAAAPRGNGHTTQRAPGYLGIEFHDLTNAQAAALHLRGPSGVEVLLVDHDGPAGKAGLEPHDLITGLNGHIVASGEALRRMIHDAGAGVEVRLSVFRNGAPVTIRARLANREQVARQAWARVNASDPAPQDPIANSLAANYVAQPAPAPSHTESFLSSMLHSGPFTGVVVEAIPQQLASFFGSSTGAGLLVEAVDLNSPAATAGLRAGDVIVRANGQPVRSTSEWTKHLHANKGKPMSLTVLRDHHELSLTLQPDPKRH